MSKFAIFTVRNGERRLEGFADSTRAVFKSVLAIFAEAQPTPEVEVFRRIGDEQPMQQDRDTARHISTKS